MYAVDNLSDAIDVTRDFLTPIRAWMWFKLGLVLLFVGGGGFNNPGGFGGDFGGTTEEPSTETGLGATPSADELLVGLVVIGAIVFVLWLLWNAFAALMEFVFVESLSADEVRVRRYMGRNVGRAIHLLLFRIVLGLGALTLIGIPVGTTLASVGFDGVTAGLVLLLALIALLVVLLYVIARRFTTVFVTAVMLKEDRGVISAWRRFWPTLTDNWKEYTVYLLLIWIVQLAVGFAVAFLGLFGIVFFGLLFGAPAYALISLAGDVGFVLGILVAIVGVITIILLWLLIDVPVQSYYRYYGLLILGDTNADLDIVADQRARVRGDGGEEDHSDAWDRGPDRDGQRNVDGLDGESTGSWDDESLREWGDSSDDEPTSGDDDSSEWRWGGTDDDRTDDRSDDRQ